MTTAINFVNTCLKGMIEPAILDYLKPLLKPPWVAYVDKGNRAGFILPNCRHFRFVVDEAWLKLFMYDQFVKDQLPATFHDPYLLWEFDMNDPLFENDLIHIVKILIEAWHYD